MTPTEDSAGPSYRELTLRVVGTSGSGGRQVFIDGPEDAHGEATFSLEHDPERVQVLVEQMGRLAASPGAQRTGPLAAAREFGEELMDGLISGKVRDVYLQARDRAEQGGYGLRLSLYLPSDLMDLPWEFLCEEGKFLCHSVNTPVVRCVNLGKASSPYKVEPPLTVLGMVSSPEGAPKLDAAAERRRLEEAVEPLVAAGYVKVRWLARATLSELDRVVGRPDEIHVVHYIGHGGFIHGQGALALESEEGKEELVSGEEIGTMLQDERSLRLVVLNACEGARTSERDPFSSVAASLLRFAVPAVIGMQFAISDSAAIAFAGRLYEALSDRFPIDAALAQSRRALVAGRHGAEFGTPVLYLSSGETRLFEVVPVDGDEGDKCDISLDLRHLQDDGEAVRWELVIENTGDAELRSVMASDSGRQLADPFELRPGRRKVVRWTAAADAPPEVTVTASDRLGSGITEGVSPPLEQAEQEEAAEATPAEAQEVIEQATDEALVEIESRRLLDAACLAFENGSAPGQIEALRDAVGDEDSLVVLCRCAREQDRKRQVLLLLTNRQLVWSREGPKYSGHWGRMLWRDVVEVGSLDGGGQSAGGFRILAADGRQLAFNSFDGSGLDFGERGIDFGPGSVCALVRDLATADGGLPGLPGGVVVRTIADNPELRLQANRDRILEMSSDFENGLYQDQQQALLAELRADEDLLRMVRCAEGTKVLRSTVLLLTSARAISVRQSFGAGNPTVQTVDWADVIMVDGDGQSVRMVLGNGQAPRFSQIQNQGIALEASAEMPMNETVSDLIRTLVSAAGGGANLEERAEQNRQQLSEIVGSFENGLYDKQKNLLLEALNSTEELIAMCRCAREQDAFRSVALLFTSERLLACRESAFSSGSIDIVPWNEIRAVNTRDTVLDFVTVKGRRISLGKFNGKGVTWGGDKMEFATKALRELALGLMEADRSS